MVVVQERNPPCDAGKIGHRSYRKLVSSECIS